MVGICAIVPKAGSISGRSNRVQAKRPYTLQTLLRHGRELHGRSEVPGLKTTGAGIPATASLAPETIDPNLM